LNNFIIKRGHSNYDVDVKVFAAELIFLVHCHVDNSVLNVLFVKLKVVSQEKRNQNEKCTTGQNKVLL
jgi:hypothetical protein